jgi:PKHD-type hydroxylase
MSDENLELSNDSIFTDYAVTAKLASLDIVSVNKSDIFTAEQCDTILNSCIEELWLPTKVVGDKALHSARRQKLRGDVQGFPFLDIRTVTKDANDNVYDFNLLGIIDQDFPQIFKYSEGDEYNWHMELNPMAPSRKLTFIINLTDPTEYEGGEIEFLNVDTKNAGINDRGVCLVFPSYTAFKINKITKGNAKFIIGSVHGALFK